MTTVPQPGPISSIPVLQEASQLALVIHNASQKTRRNKAAFNHLANEASEFVDNMINFYRDMERYFPEGVPDDLAVVFQSTVNSIKPIRNCTLDAASRNFFTALLFSRSDVKKIKAHYQALAMKKDCFKIISNDYIKKFATKLSAETLKALEQRFGGAIGVEEIK